MSPTRPLGWWQGLSVSDPIWTRPVPVPASRALDGLWDGGVRLLLVGMNSGGSSTVGVAATQVADLTQIELGMLPSGA